MKKERACILGPAIQLRLTSYLDGKNYEKLYINMSRLYSKTLEGFEWRQHFSEKIEALGGIGEKGSQRKAWLIELSQDS